MARRLRLMAVAVSKAWLFMFSRPRLAARAIACRVLARPMRAFDPPAVAAVEVLFCDTPGEAFAAGAQHVDMVFGDMDAACGSAIRDALRPQSAGLAGVRTGTEPPACLCRRARGQHLSAGAADDIMLGIIAEALGRKALGVAGSGVRSRQDYRRDIPVRQRLVDLADAVSAIRRHCARAAAKCDLQRIKPLGHPGKVTLLPGHDLDSTITPARSSTEVCCL